MLIGHVLKVPRPLRRLRQLAYVARHYRAHRAYGAAIAAARADGLIRPGGVEDYKYLGIYLAEFFTPAARRAIILAHYRFLSRTLAPVARSRFAGPTELWRRDDAAGHQLRIMLDAPGISRLEGEHQLRFLMDGTLLFTLTFAFVPGESLGLAPGPLLFIGGLQGGLHRRQDIRTAAKANGEIAPSAMLLLAARALAAALGVERAAGIASDQQVAVNYARDRISFDYARLWQEAGGTLMTPGFFLLPSAAAHPPDETIRGTHRARTRRKRQLKLALTAEIEATARALFPLATTGGGSVHPLPARKPLATLSRAACF